MRFYFQDIKNSLELISPFCTEKNCVFLASYFSECKTRHPCRLQQTLPHYLVITPQSNIMLSKFGFGSSQFSLTQSPFPIQLFKGHFDTETTCTSLLCRVDMHFPTGSTIDYFKTSSTRYSKVFYWIPARRDPGYWVSRSLGDVINSYWYVATRTILTSAQVALVTAL